MLVGATPQETAGLGGGPGWSPAALAEATDAPARASALRWVCGLRTKTGTSREDRIAACGRLAAATLHSPGLPATYGLAHLWCRDRACPPCAARLSHETRAKLRAFAATRGVPEQRLAFATLTQPKRHAASEGPKEAIERLVRARAYLLHRSRHLARCWRRDVAGAVFALEVTYSTPEDGARWPGWHVHFHAIVEFTAPPARFVAECPPGADPEILWSAVCRQGLRDLWRQATDKAGDAAQPQAIDVQALTARNVGQVGKYAVGGAHKTWVKLRDSPRRIAKMRRLWAALAQRRLITGWGTWERWRTAEPEADPGGSIAVWGYTLADLYLAHETGQDVVLREPVAIDGRRVLTPVDSCPAAVFLTAAKVAGRSLQAQRAYRRGARAPR